MFEVITVGKPTKVGVKVAVKAVGFFADRLLTPAMKNRVSITVKFKKRLYRDDGCMGAAECSDVKRGRPKDFMILVDQDLTAKKLIRTLAHEMVHVKQFAKGELSFTGKKTQWKSKTINEDKIGYWDCPWEIEAYGMEIGLYVRWKAQIKTNKNKAKS